MPTTLGAAVDITVTDEPGRHRYEAIADGAVAGFANYQRAGRLVVFTHTEVDDAFEGMGVGSTLVREALEDVRRQGLHVLPVCPFVRSYLDRHPEYAELVYQAPESTARD